MSKKQKNKKTTKKQEVQKAGFGGLAGGAALAGAGAMIYDQTSGQQFAQFETADGHVVAIWADTDNNGIYDQMFVNATPVEENEVETTTEVVQAEVPDQNDEGLTFSEAFAEARSELGAGGVFEWHGQEYNTFYAEEWQNMSEEQHNEWASLSDEEKLEYYDHLDEYDDDDISETDVEIAENDLDDDMDDDFDDDDNHMDDDVSDWELA